MKALNRFLEPFSISKSRAGGWEGSVSTSVIQLGGGKVVAARRGRVPSVWTGLNGPRSSSPPNELPPDSLEEGGG